MRPLLGTMQQLGFRMILVSEQATADLAWGGETLASAETACGEPAADGAGIGGPAAVGVWFTDLWIAAMTSGIGGFATTLAMQGWPWRRRMIRASDTSV
jgi:hypothetical protein